MADPKQSEKKVARPRKTSSVKKTVAKAGAKAGASAVNDQKPARKSNGTPVVAKSTPAKSNGAKVTATKQSVAKAASAPVVTPSRKSAATPKKAAPQKAVPEKAASPVLPAKAKTTDKAARPAARKKPVVKKSVKPTKTSPKSARSLTAVPDLEKTIEPVVAAAADAASQGVEEAVSGANKVLAATTAWQSDGVENAMTSGQMLTESAGKLAEEMLAFNQDHLDRSLEAAREAFDCRDLPSLLAWQTRVAQENLDSLISGSTRLTDIYLETARNMGVPWQGSTAAFFNIMGEKAA